MADERLTYTVPEAARVLGVSANTLRRMIWSGDFPAHRARTRVLISRAELDRWLRSPARKAVS